MNKKTFLLQLFGQMWTQYYKLIERIKEFSVIAGMQRIANKNQQTFV